MPELPEVEIEARGLRAVGQGRPVEAVLHDGQAFGQSGVVAWEVLTGQTVQQVRRHGKQLAIDFREHTLLLHLGMTGRFRRVERGEPPRSYERVRWLFGDAGAIAFVDPRRLARARVCLSADAPDAPEWRALGPDALLATPAEWEGALRRGRGPLKPRLLDQHRLAGIGNIYASEGLFRARISPARPAGTLSVAEVDALRRGVCAAMEETLAASAPGEVAYLHAGAPNPFRVYGRAGDGCPLCGTPIVRSTQAGRSTFHCVVCQV